MQIRLATRGSRLALAQSGLIADALRGLGATVELVRVKTLGDVSSAPLSSIGGAGVFVVAVREAVLTGDCDVAVHSLKDLPTTPADGLTLAAIPPREDPRDALCARDGLTLAALPAGATVGTGSPRRAAQLAAARPDLAIVDIRGNVDTRLGRVGHDLDAVVLAVAGLNRIGRQNAITEYLDPDVLVPAPAQGALAIECRHGDQGVRELLAQLDDDATRTVVEAERAVMRLVEAGCSAPFGALGTLIGDELMLTARLAGVSGARTVHLAGSRDGADDLVRRLADAVAPLRGMRVVMPRSGLAVALGTEGVTVTEVSLTTTEPLDATGLVDALEIGGFEILAFTSARTLGVLADAGVQLAGLIPTGTTIAAVGEATGHAVRAAGLHVALQPASGAGGAALAAVIGPGPGTVLIPGAAEPAPDLAADLRSLGHPVIEVPVYRTVTATQLDAGTVAAWPDDFDVFVATAPSAARAAAELLGVPGPPAVAIGPTSAAAATAAGFDVVAVAARTDPGRVGRSTRTFPEGQRMIIRPRRLRTTAAMRALVAETRPHPAQLVLPVFVADGLDEPHPIGSLPGVSQHTIESLVAEARRAVDAGLKGIMLFGVPKPDHKDAIGSAGTAPDGILNRGLTAVRNAVGDDLVVMADTCLDEFTDHGHCGVLDDAGQVDNDATLERYVELAISQAVAGAHMVGPSGMMDGQVAAIRAGLDGAGFADTAILAYAVKYASAFYGPFREAVNSALVGDRRTYQQDPPNRREGIMEAALDQAEGADIVMVKPAGYYLDVLADVAARSSVPVAAYHVSGEYAMVCAAAERGWLNRDAALAEAVTAIVRAGADLVLTYAAIELADRFAGGRA